jgi:hypothetical protein
MPSPPSLSPTSSLPSGCETKTLRSSTGSSSRGRRVGPRIVEDRRSARDARHRSGSKARSARRDAPARAPGAVAPGCTWHGSGRRHIAAHADAGCRQAVRHAGVRRRLSCPWHHASCRPIHQRAEQQHRRSHHTACTVCAQSAAPEEGGGRLRMGEDRRFASQAPSSWSEADGLGLHLHGRGVQPGEVALAPAGSGVSVEGRTRPQSGHVGRETPSRGATAVSFSVSPPR